MRVEARPAVDDERDPAQAAVLAERVDDLAARTVGQREVEHDERRFLAARENLQRLADAARQRDDEARPLQDGAHDLPDLRVVLDDEHVLVVRAQADDLLTVRSSSAGATGFTSQRSARTPSPRPSRAASPRR